MTKLHIGHFTVAGALTLAVPVAFAQPYPWKPIRLIVPFAPGGSNDTMSRIVGQKLGENLGQQVVVDNRAGAGGNIGSEIVARSTPDGHTLLMGSSPLAVNASLFRKLPFDPVKDFAPVELVAGTNYVLVDHPSVPANSVKELIALAKKKPGQLNYSSGGVGSPLHLAAELFKAMTGTQMTHVPYKGGVPAVAAVLGTETQLVFGSLVTVLPHVKAGRLRALGVTSAQRSTLIPELPTIAEAGVPGYELINWYGLLAPAGTPHAAIARLNEHIARILQLPDVRDKLLSQGLEPLGGTPQQFAAYLRADVAKWAKVIKELGLRSE